MKNNILAVCLTGLFVLAFANPALAADYPEDPVELIVAYSAGGGTDTGARMLVKAASKYIPQPLVVVNKPGAGGETGFTALAKAKPDGYTIGFINPPSTVLLPVMRKTGYQMSDFKLIINIVLDPGVLAVRAESPYKTLDDFINAAKENPGRLTISNAGVGSDAHMSIIDFADKAGIEVNPVPFKGAAPARTAALGGHVDAVVMKVGEAKTYVQSKQARVLAVMSDKRVESFPDVPTFKEKGLNVLMAASRGIAGPKDMPDSVARYLHDKLKQTIEDPEFIQMMEKTGIGISYMGPEDYEQFCNQLLDTYGPLWKKAM
jgi:tripartite-type tricarboxylate transporter receptor subunit TctC